MSELKRCPFCGNEPVVEGNLVACNNLNCPTYDNYWTDPMIFTCDQWNTRPIEDALHARIAELEAAQARWVMASERLPKVSGWYLTGLVYFLGSPYSSEVYFDAENIEPRWNNITSDKIYCWLDGVPELPQPPEVQK